MMKNPFKKLLTLALVVTVGVSLSACGSSDYNTEAPYGTISGTYATNDGHDLTNKQLYDLLRPNGYNVFYNQIEQILLSNYVNESDVEYNYLALDFNDDYDDMHQIIIETLFNAQDMDDINDISDSDWDEMVEQIIDSLYTSNVYITTADLYRTSSQVKFSETVFDYFKLNLAKENFGNDRLTEIINKGEEYDETTTDEDGEETTETVTNTYYISDEDVENYYDNNYRQSLDYNAVIVGFNTIAEYEAAFTSASTYNGFTSNVKDYAPTFYAQLYNEAYDYKNNLTISSRDMSANELINQSSITTVNVDKLSAFNTDLASFVTNMEAGQWTTSYKEFGGKYYMVYKLTDTTKDKWEDLTSQQQEALYDEVYDEIFESKMTSSFISTEISEILKDLIEDEAIEIFDPVFALIFDSNFADYTYEAKTLTDKDNVITMTYNGEEYSITPDELFDELAKFFGVSTSISYFTNYAIANSDLVANLDSDDEDAAEEAFDAEMSKFKNNEYASSGITNQFTEEEFLLTMFGYDNESDVINNYFMAQQAIAYLATDYSDLYFELLYLTGQNNYENFFDLDIKHVLLFVDYDLDGTLDKPEEFMAKLALEDNGSTKVTAFKNTIIQIYSEICKEVEYLSGSDSDNLDKIVRMYNDGDSISYRRADSLLTNRTWDDIKTYYGYDFNIQIKVEELGNVNNSNASQYVTEFSDHVEAMYRDLYNTNKTNYDNDNPDTQTDLDYTKNLLTALDEYLEDEHLEQINTSTNFEELCMSSFGFHMLLSVGGESASNATFTIEDDRKADTEDDYYIYENIVVTYDDEELLFNGYSETAWPSKDQLQVYVYETASDDGVESLKSTTESIINEFYSTFTTRFTNDTFVSYLIYNMLSMDIQFSHSSITVSSETMMDNWFEINMKQLDEYKDTSSTSTHAYAGWWEFIESYDFTA